MRIPRIYSSQSLAEGQHIDLDENASRHLSKVLRMQAGRELIVFNGEGGEYRAEITEVSKKTVTVKVGEFNPEDRQSPLTIHLGIGISRGERFDYVLQKATELGVTAITPLFTERVEVKLNGPRLEKKLNHWQQILVSACEQCQRNQLPQLHAPQNLDQWLTERDEDTCLVLHHRSDVSLNETTPPNSVALVIGPEGGLSQNEIENSLKRGFQALTLGPRVFRTETAPVAAISILQYLWGDLS